VSPFCQAVDTRLRLPEADLAADAATSGNAGTVQFAAAATFEGTLAATGQRVVGGRARRQTVYARALVADPIPNATTAAGAGAVRLATADPAAGDATAALVGVVGLCSLGQALAARAILTAFSFAALVVAGADVTFLEAAAVVVAKSPEAAFAGRFADVADVPAADPLPTADRMTGVGAAAVAVVAARPAGDPATSTACALTATAISVGAATAAAVWRAADVQSLVAVAAAAFAVALAGGSETAAALVALADVAAAFAGLDTDLAHG
jgi:hypothetical protein